MRGLTGDWAGLSCLIRADPPALAKVGNAESTTGRVNTFRYLTG
jgi:hypothetical protein